MPFPPIKTITTEITVTVYHCPICGHELMPSHPMERTFATYCPDCNIRYGIRETVDGPNASIRFEWTDIRVRK